MQNKRKKFSITVPILIWLLVLICSSTILVPWLHPLEAQGTVQGYTDRNEGQQLRVGFDPFLPPFQYEDEAGYSGFNIDILKAVAEIQGIEFDLLPMSLGQAITQLEQGEIDLILGIQYKANYKEEIEFTDPFYTSSVGMLVPKENDSITSLSDLSEKIVALQRDTLEYDFLQNIRRVKYNGTTNQVNAFHLLINGRADAFVGNQKTAEYLLKKYNLAQDYVFIDRHILPLEYTIAVHAQNYSILEQMNDGLNQIKVQGTYKSIYNTWFMDESTTLQKRIQSLIRGSVIVGAVFLVIFTLGVHWNRQLRQQVQHKTKDVHQLNESLAIQVKEVRNSQQLKEQILNSSPRGIITFDQVGVITSMNNSAKVLMSLEHKCIGQTYLQLPLVAELLEAKRRDVVEEGKRFSGEFCLDMQEDYADRERYVRYYVYPLFDYEQNIAGMIFSFEDITEERKVREQLFEQEKSRALSQLVAGIAHEIRNPLTSIKTFVELIPLKLKNERFQQELLTHVPKEIERLNQLIGGLIDYAKPTSLHREWVGVDKIIQASTLLLLRVAENKGFSIATSVPSELYVKVDENQLKQVLINLLLNAIEALEEKQADQKGSEELVKKENHVIKIKAWGEVEDEEERVMIQVEDQGTGMSEIQIKRVLEPFFSTKAKGTGLGLSLSYQYVQENGGEMKIDSRAGQGTTITLSFKGEVKTNE